MTTPTTESFDSYPIATSAEQLAQWLDKQHLWDRREAFKTILDPFQYPLSQPRHTMIVAEQGMGKTALLKSVGHYLEETAPHYPVLWISDASVLETGDVLAAFCQSWQNAAQLLLDGALKEINRINDPLGIIWSQKDLLRAITLMKLQTDVDALVPQGEFLPRQRLANAIRSAIPKVKRLHFSAVNLGIRQLVQRLQDPWLQVATQIVHPTLPETIGLFRAVTHSEPHTTETIASTAADPLAADPSTLTASDPNLSVANAEIEPKALLSPSVTGWAAADLFCQWLDRQLGATSFRPICLLDNWDALATSNNAALNNDIVSLLNILKNTRHQCVFTCRSEVLSKAFSGPMVAYFLPPLILSPLSSVSEQQMAQRLFTAHSLQLTPPAMEKLLAMGQGNPLALTTVATLIQRHAQQRRQSMVDTSDIAPLGIEIQADIAETLLSRVILEHMPHESNVMKVVASLLRFSDGLNPFALDDMVTRIHTSQQLGRVFVNSVLATLEREQFLAPPPQRIASDTLAFTHRQRREFLAHKTRWIETDLPCDEKLAYLKKVIPLAIQAGEFDAQRTQEAITLASSKGFDDLRPFLEEALKRAVDGRHPVPQRLTAMASLTSLGSQVALDTLLTLTHEPQSPIIVEYALRYIKSWAQHQRPLPQQAQAILARMLELLDSTTVEHRRLTYQTIAALPIAQGSQAIVALYLKGLVDTDDAIRTLAIEQLYHADLNAALVRQALIDATQDKAASVREVACRLLKQNPHPKAMEALLGVLEHDTSSQLRQLAAQLIGQNPDAQTTQTLLTALSLDMDTDVQVAIVRSLRHHNPALVEPALHQAFQSAWASRYRSAGTGTTTPSSPPELLWAFIQTLRDIGQQTTTLATLQHALQSTDDPILTTCLQSAFTQVQQRVQQRVQQQTRLSAPKPPALASL